MKRIVLAAIKTARPVLTGLLEYVPIVQLATSAKETPQRQSLVLPVQRIQEPEGLVLVIVRLAQVGTTVLQAQYPVLLAQLVMTAVGQHQCCAQLGIIPNMEKGTVFPARPLSFALIHLCYLS